MDKIMTPFHKHSSRVNLYLDESQNSRAHPYKNSFFQNELNATCDILMKIISRSEDLLERNLQNEFTGKSQELGHDIILISGERGVGKTSFMLSLEQYIQSNDSRFSNPIRQKLKKSLMFLPKILEPALTEEGEFFLATIISLIKQTIIKYHKHPMNNNSEIVKGYNDWKSQLNLLESCLIGLNSQTYKKMVEKTLFDREIAGNEILTTVDNASKLRENFVRFISLSVNCLNYLQDTNASAMVLMIDDVDTSFQNAWFIMETLRKYCISPQLIVIASGHLELFEASIKKRIIDELKEVYSYAIGIEDKLSIDEYRQNVGMTARQYLLKLFPRENHIHLENLSVLFSDNRMNMSSISVLKKEKFKTTSNEMGVSLKQLMDDFRWVGTRRLFPLPG